MGKPDKRVVAWWESLRLVVSGRGVRRTRRGIPPPPIYLHRQHTPFPLVLPRGVELTDEQVADLTMAAQKGWSEFRRAATGIVPKALMPATFARLIEDWNERMYGTVNPVREHWLTPLGWLPAERVLNAMRSVAPLWYRAIRDDERLFGRVPAGRSWLGQLDELERTLRRGDTE